MADLAQAQGSSTQSDSGNQARVIGEPAKTDQTPAAIVSEVLEQRKKSLEYFNNNFYGEFAEVYRNVKARTSPIMVNNDKGELVEDTSRTNVCLPDHHVMVRRGVARLTRNPPDLKVRGGQSQGQRDSVSAMLMFQWDRGRTQPEFRKVVLSGKTFGWGVAKSFWDKLTADRQYRRRTMQLQRPDMLKLQGVPDDQIDTQMQGQNPALNDDELNALIAQHGDEVTLPTTVTRFNGPVMRNVFIGDLFPEPGFTSLNNSGYVDEMSFRDETWLKYWQKQVTTNPETGQEQPVISAEAAQEVLDKIGEVQYINVKDLNLRRRLREAVNITDPLKDIPKISGSRKKFLLDERHSIINGCLVIDFIGEESIYLGRLWYPWDTYGRYTYTEFVPIPDIIEGIGDSTPRISRYLMQLRNARMNQTTDFINNKLLPFFKGKYGVDFTTQGLQRTAWGKVLLLKNMSDLEPSQDHNFPAEAWNDQASLVRETQQVAPEMSDFGSGTSAIPQAGHLATTALLQQRAADAVLADELNQLNLFVGDTLELWLYMNQQGLEDPVQIPQGVSTPIDRRISAISANTEGGNPREITIDPMDIQDDFEIMPEAGSTLAEDDEFKRAAIERGFQMAMANPDLFNRRAFAEKLANTIPGMKAEDVLLPPQGPPPPPPPVIHINFGVTAKFEDLAPDVQADLLQKGGMPTTDTHIAGALKLPIKINEAANATEQLQQPVNDGGADGSGNRPLTTQRLVRDAEASKP